MRNVFYTVNEMAIFLFNEENRTGKLTPYQVEIDDQIRFVFAGNSDQAVSAVARQLFSITVSAVTLRKLVSAAEIINRD